MKIFMLSAMLALVSASSAYAAEGALEFKIDWDDNATLNVGEVLMCDDDYFSHAEIEVPGTAGKDFYVVIEADVTDGEEPSLGCRVTKKMGQSSVKYKVEVDSSCTIKVYQTYSRSVRSPKVARIELGDAC